MIDGYRDMWFTIAKNCETNSLNSDAMDSDISNLPAIFQTCLQTFKPPKKRR
jgi:hypothetical protein